MVTKEKQVNFSAVEVHKQKGVEPDKLLCHLCVTLNYFSVPNLGSRRGTLSKFVALVSNGRM